MDRRELLKAGLALGGLPLLAPAFALAHGADDPILLHVDAELRPLAKGILEFAGKTPQFSRATLAQRRGSAAYAARPWPDTAYEKHMVPGGKGQPDVAVYAVNAKPEGDRPGIVFLHGGGFVAGSAQASLRMVQELAKALDCCVVSVDYRLAPEVTYTGSIEDNYAALKWLHASAASLGVDPARLAVMGESAGGGHAALLAITARDRGEVPLIFQSLVYPMLDDRTGSSRPVPPHVGKLIWTAESNRFGWECFLGTAPGGRTVPVGAVPARVGNLAGLPPAWIGVGSIDLFHDEDVDYAQRLNEAGVPTELIVVPGAFHGFDAMPLATKIGARFNAAKLDALRRGLGIS